MQKWLSRGLLLLILITAAALRLTGLAWDDYHHYHPDERYITWVATSIEFERPSGQRGVGILTTLLDPHQSALNPFYWPPDAKSEGIVVLQDEPRKFAYGHVPLYLGVIATRLAEWLSPLLVPLFPADWTFTQDVLNGAEDIEFRHLTAVTRTLTGLIDVATVYVIFLLGRRLYGTAVGLLAAAFLAINVMHIQLAHFFASDPYLTFFVVTSVYFMVVSVERRAKSEERKADTPLAPRPSPLTPLLLAAIFSGLAVGSKFAAIMLLFPLLLAAWLCYGQQWMIWGGTAVFVAFLTFALTNPFALLDNSCTVISPAMQIGSLNIPALNWKNCYLENITTQSSMVRGAGDQAFTRQYTGTHPYLYYIEMQLRWGMGPLLGLVAFVGFAWAILEIRRLEIRDWLTRRNQMAPRPSPLTPLSSSYLLPLAWLLPYFLTTGSFFVKFMRYLQPMTPFLMMYGAALLWYWRKRAKEKGKSLSLLTCHLLLATTLLTTIIYATAFVSMYSKPHPWVAASEWVFSNIEPGTPLLSEQWDDSLPSTMFMDGERGLSRRLRRRQEYPNSELTWHTGTGGLDNEQKLERNLSQLAQAEYLTILSNRVYGVDPRLPDRYPLSSQYHQLLFAGSLGYEPVYIASRAPHIFGLALMPDLFSWPSLQPPQAVADHLSTSPTFSFGRTDESFVAYDQPLTMIFRNVGGLTADQMRQQFQIE